MNIVPLISELVALSVGIVAVKTARPKYIVIIIGLVFLTCISEGILEIAGKSIPPRNRFLWYNIYSFIEIGTWYGFFLLIFENSVRIKRLAVILLTVVILFSIVEMSIYRTWFLFHADSYRFYSLSIILFSVLYLLKIIRIDKTYFPARDPVFWFCAGCIVFHSVFFVHLTVINFPAFRKDRESIKVFNTLLNLANISYYLLLCLGFYTSLRNHRMMKHQSSKV